MWAKWYSRQSCRFSKWHRLTNDWLDSDPDHRETECGRTRTADITEVRHDRPPTHEICNRCLKALALTGAGIKR